MTATVKHIDCPKEWETQDDYGSHLPLLWLTLNKVKDIPVTEFGCGLSSTPLLANLCMEQDRGFEFVDTDKDWIEKVNKVLRVEGLFPESTLVGSCLDVDWIGNEIIFVDSKPGEERKDIIEKWRNHCPVIIAHDVESGAEYVYGMNKVLNSFKYRLYFQPEGKPHTCVVSNTVNVTTWI